MKKKTIITAALLAALCLMLSACTLFRGIPAKLTYGTAPDTVTIDGNTYVGGFTDGLFPHEYEEANEEYTIDGKSYHKIIGNENGFDLVHGKVGKYSEGEIFVLESQLDDAKAYYNDFSNYTYSVRVGGVDGIRKPCEEMDPEKLILLNTFAEDNMYDPLDAKHNSKVETVDLLIHGIEKDCYTFYMTSNDTLFVSSKAAKFYLIDGELYMLYNFDCGRETENDNDIWMKAVKVPEELSAYFSELILDLK